MKMKIALLLSLSPLFSPLAFAQSAWVEDTDGEYAPNEYRVVDTKGAVTRRPCPYTCEMRGIPKRSCKEWHSITDTNECYVQDLRISQNDAMPRSTEDESTRAMQGYKK